MTEISNYQAPINPIGFNAPLEANQPFNNNVSNPGSKATYRTSPNMFNCLVFPISFISGF